MRQIGDLLGLWRGARSSAAVKKLALAHVDDLDRRISEMQGMRDTLRTLAVRCHGDQRPECPILEDLAADPGRSAGRAGHRVDAPRHRN